MKASSWMTRKILTCVCVMNYEFLSTNRSLTIITPDRNTAHSPVIARERAAGGLRTTSVGCAHPTLLAKNGLHRWLHAGIRVF